MRRAAVLLGIVIVVWFTVLTPAVQAQPGAIAIVGSSGWTWWWAGSDLSAAAVEAATRVAEARGFRVLAAPAPGVPVLSLAVSVSDESVAYRGDWAVGTAQVTVRAELRLSDGSVWRGSRSGLALWLVRPIRTSREAAVRRAVVSAASGVAGEALERLAPAGGDGQAEWEERRPSLECDAFVVLLDGTVRRGPEPWCQGR